MRAEIKGDEKLLGLIDLERPKLDPVQLLMYFAGILALTIVTLVSCLYLLILFSLLKTLLLCLPAEHHWLVCLLYVRLWFTISGDNE